MKPKVLLIHLGINTAVTLFFLTLTVPSWGPLHTGLVDAPLVTRYVVLAAFVAILQGLFCLGLRGPRRRRDHDSTA